jgi:hypothetical protein
VVLVGGSLRADTILRANLHIDNEPSLNPESGMNELGRLVPTTSTGASRPKARGEATLVLNDARTAMTLSATVFDLDFTGSQTPNDPNDNLTNAHIHANATVGPTGTATVVWGFIGSPQNDTNPADVIVTPFATGVGGSVTAKWDAPEGNGTATLTNQLNNILTGHSYINFHSVQFGPGEVRGMIVPEPSSIVLASLGVAGLLVARHMRRRRAG